MNDNEPGQKATSTGLRFQAAVTMVLRDVREPGDEVDTGLPLALEPAFRGMTSSTIEKAFDSLGLQTLAAVERLVEARTGGAAGKPEEQSAANAPIDPTLGSNDLRLQIDARILKSSSILVHEAFDQVFRGALGPERVQALPSIIQCAFRDISSATIIGYAELIPEEDLSQVEPATPIIVLPTAPTKDHARELAVPSLIAGTVMSLGSTVGSAPFPLIPLCLLIAAAAVGNAVRLRSRLFPGLMSGALQLVLCGLKHGPLWQAFNLLVQPLREREKQRLSESGCRRKDLTEQIAGREQKQAFAIRHYGSPRLELASELLQLRQYLRPVILIENPLPGTLAQALAGAADGAALAIFDDAAIGGVLEAANKKAREDIQVLEAGWSGRTLRTPIQTVVDPAVSCAINCSAARQRELLTLEEFSDHLITIWPSAQVGSPLETQDLGRYADQILRLADLRESGRQDEIGFAPRAEARLAEFRREKMRQIGSVPEEQRPRVSMAWVIAGKFALDFCLLCPDLFEIPESLVEAAIDIEERLFTSATPDPDSPPRRRAPAEDLTRKSAAQYGREKLLKKIAQKQPVSRRDLQQSCHRWKQVGLDVDLEQLLAEGIVHWNTDHQLVLGQAPGLATSNGSMD